ncbi:hypothetical protein ACFY84_11555 [Streptomyces sp. NPDC012438]|uniref:hypothetical protein n=1 Tax=Streptomyces sp. NPDC012438 TaxID=3364833 RepID=UPI0036EA0878
MTTPDKAYRWWCRDPLTRILFKRAFGEIGVGNLRWIDFDRVAGRTPEQRRRLLDDTERRFAALAPDRRGPRARGNRRAPVAALTRSGT